MRETTRTPLTTLNDLQASAADMGETPVAWFIHWSNLYGRVEIRMPLLKKTHMKAQLLTQWSIRRRFCGRMRPKMEIFGTFLTLHSNGLKTYCRGQSAQEVPVCKASKASTACEWPTVV